MSLDCVQTNPKNAVEAWNRVVKFDRPDHDYFGDWVNENAYSGLMHGKRDQNNGSYPNYEQPVSVRTRYTVNTLIDDIKTPEDAKRQACVAVFDKNSDPLKVKARTTQCEKGRTCQSIDDEGYFVDASKRAKKKAEQTSQGAVARGYCVRKFVPTKSNVGNRHNYTDRLQKAEDLIANLQREINALKQSNPWACNKSQ